MTFRAKPVVKRSNRPSWESRDRRNFYLNLGFGLVVVVALIILVIAVGVTYYNDHLASVGSVAGQSISKDELRDRVEIETWRLEEATSRVRTELVAGRLTQAQADLQDQIIAEQREAITGIAMERIVDNRIQADLAEADGIAVSDADIDARLAEEATSSESRHAWMIEVAPEVEDGAGAPTADQVAAARAKAETALRDLSAGKAWDEVAKTVSTDTATAPQAGDLGWLHADDSQLDQAFITALFAAEPDAPTTVVEGDDGVFRIGRMTESAPEAVDPAYLDRIADKGIDLAKYRAVVAGDVIRQKLEDKVVADAIKPGPQRDVAEIYLSEATTQLPESAVKVSHILYSPKDDPAAAQSGEIPADDPSWAAAEKDAQAAYTKLQADATKFESIARAESDEEQALGEAGTGGALPGYISEDAGYVESFLTPILAANASDGQILPPIKTEFGHHIVRIDDHRPDLADIKRQVDGGADFAELSRRLSEGTTAQAGGDIGWIAKSQLSPELTAAIFLAPIGGTSEIVTIATDGQYLYDVRAEEERTPAGRQLEDIRASAFSDWYQPKKDAVNVVRDPAFLPTEG